MEREEARVEVDDLDAAVQFECQGVCSLFVGDERDVIAQFPHQIVHLVREDALRSSPLSKGLKEINQSH